MNLKPIKRTELQVNNIVHAHGARFIITSVRIIVSERDAIDFQNGIVSSPFVMVANGKWLDGNVIPFYFGPDNDWKFQGNDGATDCIEIH